MLRGQEHQSLVWEQVKLLAVLVFGAIIVSTFLDLYFLTVLYPHYPVLSYMLLSKHCASYLV